MLFTNKTLEVQEKMMKFGTVAGTTIGEYGRGRREVFLPTPKELTENIAEGLITNLTIGFSKTGRPRINQCNANAEAIFMILSTKRDYTRRGNGYIEVPKDQSVEIIARGNGADGDAGRIGTWDALILKAHEGDIFRVIWGGYGYGYEDTFYVVLNGAVHTAEQSEVEDLYESLDTDVPFTLHFEDNRPETVDDEWIVL